MIFDAILLALAEVYSTDKRGVAILPGMRIAQGDAVQICHLDSGYELWLSGNLNVDRAVIAYEDVWDHKGELDSLHWCSMNCFMTFSDRLLAPGGSRGRIRDCRRSPIPS